MINAQDLENSKGIYSALRWLCLSDCDFLRIGQKKGAPAFIEIVDGAGLFAPTSLQEKDGFLCANVSGVNVIWRKSENSALAPIQDAGQPVPAEGATGTKDQPETDQELIRRHTLRQSTGDCEG